MRPRLFGKLIPYALVLAGAAYLYATAGRIEASTLPGRLGPDVWPKAILVLAMAACAYEIVKTLFFPNPDEVEGVLEEIIESAEVEHEAPHAAGERRYPALLVAGIALTVGYVALIEQAGFFLCTAFYLAGFMVLGRYRRPGVVLATSLAGTLVFMFVFMRIVYVSLPVGREPFLQVSVFVMQLLGIR